MQNLKATTSEVVHLKTLWAVHYKPLQEVHSIRYSQVPEDLRSEKCFAAYFEACERAGFTKAEDEKYTQDMMNEWDIENAKNLAVREGREEGRQQGLEEGKSEMAKALLKKGIDVKTISECSGLSEKAIRAL